MIGRRALLVAPGLAAAPAVAPDRAGAQPARRTPVVGYLALGSVAADAPGLNALRDGLREQGFAEPQTVAIELRLAAGDAERARRFIQDLAAIPVDVFVAPGRTAARAIRRITNIPVVAVGLPPTPSDPELFASLARPGGSVTGFSTFGEEMSAKRLELLREIMPAVRAIGVLHNATTIALDGWGDDTEAAATRFGLRAIRVPVQGATGDVGARIAALRGEGAGALVVVRDFLTTTLLPEIVAGAQAAGIAVVAEQRLFTEAGGLFSYGANLPDLFRRAGGYVARILRGEKPGDLPVQLPTSFEFVVNLRTARALDLSLPASVVARAEEVIE